MVSMRITWYWQRKPILRQAKYSAAPDRKNSSDMRQVTARTLEGLGYRVVEAPEAATALAIVSTWP